MLNTRRLNELKKAINLGPDINTRDVERFITLNFKSAKYSTTLMCRTLKSVFSKAIVGGMLP